jgi:predicted nucleic acid-binding protein
MASSSRVCWDACSWIALIQREQIKDSSGRIVENRYALARPVIDRAEKGAVEIVTSGLCLVEVNKPSPSTTREQIAAYFDNDYILLVPVDRLVGTRARSLMFAAYPGLKPPDAIHLATALIANAEELHTFDTKLLSLDGRLVKADGTPLKICRPGFGGEALPLLDGLTAEPSAIPQAADLLDGDFYETLIMEGLAADAELNERRRQTNAEKSS